MKFRFARAVLFFIICITIISIASCGYNDQTSEEIIDTKIEVEYGEDANDADTETENEEAYEVISEDNSTNTVDDVVYADEYIEEEIIEETEEVVIEETIVENEELVSLGQFTLTAYCSCPSCCGQYAYGRPVDENGNEIVHGAIGETLISGVSIAVDPYVIPFYTEVVMNGKTYIAHDTGGLIKGNRIDVYFDNHEDACAFGLQYAEVFVKQ